MDEQGLMSTRRQHGRGERLRRPLAVTERNLVFFRSGHAYWWLAAAGLIESFVYLLGIGWGVGSLVGEVTLPNGASVSYLAFVAPALLAITAMDSAIAESVMGFFGKLRFAKIYRPMLNTPLSPMDIALGELVWSMCRATVYSAVFLVVMIALGLVSPLRAAAALPVILLVALAFGSAGMAVATMLRSWQDFDKVSSVQFALFMFSGAFLPVSEYPEWLQVVIQVSPLYHGIEILRMIVLELPTEGFLVHAAVLGAATVACFLLASRRMTRAMYQ